MIDARYSRIAALVPTDLKNSLSMNSLQKTTQNAIAAMSRLAELYQVPGQVAASRDIAESRNLPIPLVSKILTDLSRGGLVTASPGPGGGYRLARKPSEISLKDVITLFERPDELACPYGPGWCGNREPCPLHFSLLEMRKVLDDYQRNTTFEAFAKTGSKRSGQKTSPKKAKVAQRKPSAKTSGNRNS
jgi:Rrf2 family protein